jgi:hypothetical protein
LFAFLGRSLQQGTFGSIVTNLYIYRARFKFRSCFCLARLGSSLSRLGAVCAQPHMPLLPDTRKCQCSCQPCIPLLSDTRKYKRSHSASYSSPPFRHSQLPAFAISFIFLSCQILANAVVRSQPHIPLVSDRRRCKCWRSGSYSCHILTNTSVRTQPHIHLPSVRYAKIPAFAPSLIFQSSQILANTSVHTQAHISISFSQIIANTIVRSRPHLPFLSATRKYKCLRSASSSPLWICRILRQFFAGSEAVF